MSHASTQEYFLFYVWLDAGVVVVLVGIRPRLLGTKRYRVCDVTDHRCGTRGTGRLFVRGLETWDLWGEKTQLCCTWEEEGEHRGLFMSRRKKEASCRKKAMKGL